MRSRAPRASSPLSRLLQRPTRTSEPTLPRRSRGDSTSTLLSPTTVLSPTPSRARTLGRTPTPRTWRVLSRTFARGTAPSIAWLSWRRTWTCSPPRRTRRSRARSPEARRMSVLCMPPAERRTSVERSSANCGACARRRKRPSWPGLQASSQLLFKPYPACVMYILCVQIRARLVRRSDPRGDARNKRPMGEVINLKP